MRIVHIAPNAPYNEGWGYQENLLTKHQVKLGHEVTLVIRNEKHSDSGIISTECEDYMSSDGFRVIRKLSHGGQGLFWFLEKMDVYSLLIDLKPDYIFFHGLVNRAICDVVKYQKKVNPKCVVVQDNHLDYNIGFNPKTFKQKILRSYYRWLHRWTAKHIKKVFGVTPWRKQYAEEYFGVSKDISDVLIMGADDDKIDFSHRDSIRTTIRQQNGVSEEEFLIVTGGKIDNNKKIHLLMEAVNKTKKAKLLIFGNVSGDIKKLFDAQLSDRVLYIGWITSDKVYDYFFAADLVFFPGQHSVLWEQACAAKVPCVFEKWEGMDHVNNGGNACFVTKVSVESLIETIDDLCFTEKYQAMKKIAESEKTNIYLYSKIAKRSLECYE